MKPGERQANSPRLPDGAAFMPQLRLKRLEKMIGREREGTERSRLQAARMRKEGMSIRGIAGVLRRPYSAIRDWLVRLHRGAEGQVRQEARQEEEDTGQPGPEEAEGMAGRGSRGARLQVLRLAPWHDTRASQDKGRCRMQRAHL